MSIKSRNTQFDILDSDSAYKRENFSKLLSFYSEHNSGEELTDKALQSMGFFTKGSERIVTINKLIVYNKVRNLW